ncbi:MAG: methylated-DNA--[protein]-cysteine S-methyltransferase [Planctomycetota bacterium]|jgi:methylated-DNA-[protein]-cysteine S-methyltransferase
MSNITYTRIRTKGGTALVATRGDTVVASCLPRADVSAEEQRLLERFPGAKKVASTKVPAAKAFQAWWKGTDSAVERIPVDLSGQPAFRAKVYRALRRVKPGKTVTYADLAKKAGSPRAVRAVGGAMAQNPLAPFVPCHRVLGSGGALTGYTAEGGTALKRRLLEQEGASVRANP